MSATDANDGAPYELLYWPGGPPPGLGVGRGEFVRMLLEATGTPFKDWSLDPEKDLELINQFTSDLGDGTNPPAFAVPAFRHGELVINQTPNILLYLAPKLGLAPPASESNAIYHLNAMALTILDGFSNETHDTHHPVHLMGYYEDQKPEAKRRAETYRAERLPKFLNWLQRVLDAKKSVNSPWLYGGSMTYVDLVFFQGLHGTTHAFPNAVERLRKTGEYDGVFKLYDTVAELPKVKAYMASDRRKAYNICIWRHYPELDDE